MVFSGAASQNRTDDLILTKDVLYRLSHSSEPNVLYYSKELPVCQALFRIFLIFSDFIDNSNLEDIEMVKDLLTCMNTFYKNSNSIFDKKYEASIFDLFKNLKNYIFAFIKLFKLASAKEV